MPRVAKTKSPPPFAAADDLRERIGKAETIEQVIELTPLPEPSLTFAAEAKNLVQYRLVLQSRAHAGRKGGKLLEQITARGEKVPTSKLGISPVASRWRELARLSEPRFKSRLAWIAKRGIPRPHEQRTDPSPIPPTRMRLSAWETDENGVMSRTLTADGKKLILEGDGQSV